MSLDFQICLDRSDQSRLRFVFGLKCPENLLINGAVRHDMLLYAATDEAIQPDNSYQMSGNKISVKTLDLNRDFSEIATQLNAIVDEHFEKV